MGRRRPEANERYLGVFNGGDRPANIRVDWGALKLAERCTLRDLWEKTDVGVIRGGYTSRCLPPHRNFTCDGKQMKLVIPGRRPRMFGGDILYLPVSSR